MRSWLFAALVTTGCLEAPSQGDPATSDAATADASPVDCQCPVSPCPFRFVRSVDIDGDLVAEEMLNVPVLVDVPVSARRGSRSASARTST